MAFPRHCLDYTQYYTHDNYMEFVFFRWQDREDGENIGPERPLRQGFRRRYTDDGCPKSANARFRRISEHCVRSKKAESREWALHPNDRTRSMTHAVNRVWRRWHRDKTTVSRGSHHPAEGSFVCPRVFCYRTWGVASVFMGTRIKVS
jgi:hypothetical protein